MGQILANQEVHPDEPGRGGDFHARHAQHANHKGVPLQARVAKKHQAGNLVGCLADQLDLDRLDLIVPFGVGEAVIVAQGAFEGEQGIRGDEEAVGGPAQVRLARLGLEARLARHPQHFHVEHVRSPVVDRPDEDTALALDVVEVVELEFELDGFLDIVKTGREGLVILLEDHIGLGQDRAALVAEGGFLHAHAVLDGPVRLGGQGQVGADGHVDGADLAHDPGLHVLEDLLLALEGSLLSLEAIVDVSRLLLVHEQAGDGGWRHQGDVLHGRGEIGGPHREAHRFLQIAQREVEVVVLDAVGIGAGGDARILAPVGQLDVLLARGDGQLADVPFHGSRRAQLRHLGQYCLQGFERLGIVGTHGQADLAVFLLHGDLVHRPGGPVEQILDGLLGAGAGEDFPDLGFFHVLADGAAGLALPARRHDAAGHRFIQVFQVDDPAGPGWRQVHPLGHFRAEQSVQVFPQQRPPTAAGLGVVIGHDPLIGAGRPGQSSFHRDGPGYPESAPARRRLAGASRNS